MKNFTFLTNKSWGVLIVLALTFISVKLSAQFDINLSIQHPTGVGYTNGGATVNPTGGQEPYAVAWSVTTAGGEAAWSLTAGDYSVSVTDASGQLVSEDFTLTDGGVTAGGDLQATLTIQNISCNNYTDGAAMASATGGQPPYSYMWSTGATDEYISYLGADDYSVTVTDAAGNTSAASGTVVEPIATTVTIEKSNSCGLPTTVTVTVNSGVGPFTLMWLGIEKHIVKDVEIGVPVSFEYTEQETFYLCTMNAAGCPHDNWVTVAQGYTLGANTTNINCDGTPGKIDLFPSGTIAGPATYSWIGPDGFTSDEQTLNGLDKEGDYACTVTDAGGCTATYATHIGMDGVGTGPGDVNTGLVSTRQCKGYEVDLINGNSNANDYHWEYPLGTVIGDSYDFGSEGDHEIYLVHNDATECDVPVPYTVTARPEAKVDFDYKVVGCVDSILFTDNSVVPDVTGWTWDFGGTTYKEQNPGIPADVVNNDDFEAKLTIEFGDGCSLTKTGPVQVNTINAQVPSDVTICEENGSVSLNPNADISYQYTWSPAAGLDDPNSPNPTASPTSNTTYTVDIVNGSGAESCMVTQEVNVVYAPISVETSEDVVICNPTEMVELSATHTGDDFEWYDNEQLTGDPVSTALNFMAGPGTYYASTTNAAGCASVASVTIKASPMSPPSLVQDQFSLCNDETATLEVDSPASTDNIVWYLNDQEVGTGSTMDVNPSESVEYTVVVTNADGCSAQNTAQVDVTNISVSSSSEKDEIYNGETIWLDADGGFMTYEWTPDDGTIDNPNTANPNINPTETTTYTLVVTDANGCTATSQQTIVVKETECGEPFIYLPNAFSPNGDGNNDVLYLYGLNLSSVQLSIYNRWGELVFETYDQAIGWDGTYNGEPVVPDVYGFYLKVTCGNGEKYFKKGNITVLK